MILNQHLHASSQCRRLIKRFEKAPKGWPQTKDGAALLAYLCPSNQWTIGFGCSYWMNGDLVKEGDDIFDEGRIEPLLEYNLRSAEDYVKSWVRVPLNQYQFDALVSFRFNTRETTLRTSTRLLPSINACLWDDAADAFTEFVYGTGSVDGKPYQKALRGLLIRRLCEALLFLGLDWDDAVKDDDVALPSDRQQRPDGSYRDKIRTAGKTKLSDVLTVARLHPLPDPSDLDLFESTQDDASVNVDPVGGDAHSTAQISEASAGDRDPVEAVRPASLELTQPATPAPADSNSPLPASVESSSVPAGEKGAAAVTATRPPLTPPPSTAQQSGAVAGADNARDWSSGVKPMIQSRRFWGLFLVMAGRIWMLKSGSTAVLTAVSDPLVVEMFSGFAVMAAGEVVNWWGHKKATKPLT